MTEQGPSFEAYPRPFEREKPMDRIRSAATDAVRPVWERFVTGYGEATDEVESMIRAIDTSFTNHSAREAFGQNIAPVLHDVARKAPATAWLVDTGLEAAFAANLVNDTIRTFQGKPQYVRMAMETSGLVLTALVQPAKSLSLSLAAVGGYAGSAMARKA